MSEGQITVHSATLVSRIKSVFLTWLGHPNSVASICPSSKVLTDKIADQNAVRNARVVVDLGPATGETSGALLKQMRPDAQLLAIEKMSEFVEPLIEIEDDRLIVQHGDAEDLGEFLDRHGLPSADVIVSGIPFSTMDEDTGKRIIGGIHVHLREGGTLIAYQVRDDVVELANSVFGEPEIEKVHLNIPPLTIYTWQKDLVMAEGRSTT